MKKGLKFKAVVDDNGLVKNEVKVSGISEKDLVYIMVPMFLELSKASGRKGKDLDFFRSELIVKLIIEL